MQQKTGIGIVGCGLIGKVHAEAVSLLDSARLVATYSRNFQNADALASAHQARAYSDYEEFLKDPELKIVCICSPSGLHLEHGEAAARAGKHVLVEKPIEIDLERADRLINVCRESGVKLGVIFQSRFLESTRKIKLAMDEGLLGDRMVADAYIKWYRAPEYYAGSWHGTKKMDGGGALINQAIHTIDLLRWFMGPVSSVTAMSGAFRYPEIECEDTLVGTLRYASGGLGVVVAATSVSPGFKRRIELSGRNGTIILDGDEISLWTPEGSSPDSGGLSITDGSSNPAAIATEGHRRQIEDMILAIQEDREPVVNGEEGRKSLEVVVALYQAAAARREVQLSEAP